jgi:hypothetical protein
MVRGVLRELDDDYMQMQNGIVSRHEIHDYNDCRENSNNGFIFKNVDFDSSTF